MTPTTHRYINRGESTLTPEEIKEVQEIIEGYPEAKRILDLLARAGYYLLPLDVLDQAAGFAAALQAISFGWVDDPQKTASEILPPDMAKGEL